MKRRLWIALATLPFVLLAVSPANANDEGGTNAGLASSDLQQRQLAADELAVQQMSGNSTFTVSVSGQRYNEAFGTNIAPTATVRWVCALQARNPHYSSGAGGVIAKVAVWCTGQAGTIPIRVYSLLGRSTVNSASSLRIVRESNYTQNVTVNGAERIWYVPALGTPGAARGAYFRSSASAQPGPPLIPFNIPGHASKIVYVS